MHLALVVHGLPPYARSGVETHAAALARALAALGHEVDVFAPRPMPGLALYAQRREERDGWAATWVNVPDPDGRVPDEDGAADAFGAFLDRERPEIVHFEHLRAVGLGAVEAAAKRGVPTVYTAYDCFATNDCWSLLAPDLTDVGVGDRDAEARALLARRFLEARVGGPAAWALPEELDAEARDGLERILRGPAEGVEGLDGALAEVRARVQRKRAAFAAFDARFATSRALARRLSGALGRAVDWRPTGIDLEPFASVEPVQRPSGVVRFGFMGSLARHRGLHLLLDAFATLPPERATLAVHGDSDDLAWVRRMRERAREAGAEWRGPYRAEDAADVLADFDVLVVPSLGTESASFVIPEAFAARRPVIAPRTEAFEESVRPDMEGLLFERGDVDSLAAALRRFVEEEWLLDRLAMEIREPRSIVAEAREHAATYAELSAAASRRRPAPRIPAHLEGFAARYRDLERRSTRDLFSQVRRGLEALASQMGSPPDLGDLLALAVGRGSRLRDGVLEDRRAIDWLRASLVVQEELCRELEERSAWHEGRLAELRARLERYDRDVEGLKSERAALEEARSDLDGQLESARAAMDELERERAWLQSAVEDGAAELCWLRERVTGAEEAEEGLTDREAIERHFASLESELAGLRGHEEWLRREVTSLVATLGTKTGTGPAAGDGELSREELAGAIADGLAGLEGVVRELSWRREEMAEARRASETLFARLAGGAVASRARRWDVPEATT